MRTRKKKGNRRERESKSGNGWIDRGSEEKKGDLSGRISNDAKITKIRDILDIYKLYSLLH